MAISLAYPCEEGGVLLLAHGDNYLPPRRLEKEELRGENTLWAVPEFENVASLLAVEAGVLVVRPMLEVITRKRDTGQHKIIK